MIKEDDIRNKLLEDFHEAEIIITDLTGTKDHWSIHIKSSKFKGLSLIKQHRLVYESLNSWTKKDIHALQLKTEAL